MDLTEIKNDLYEVADRIKEVGDYKLYYNRKKGRYEIHSPFGLELTLGSKTPTGEVVVRLRKTRMEKIDDLLKEIQTLKSEENEESPFSGGLFAKRNLSRGLESLNGGNV